MEDLLHYWSTAQLQCWWRPPNLYHNIIAEYINWHRRPCWIYDWKRNSDRVFYIFDSNSRDYISCNVNKDTRISLFPIVKWFSTMFNISFKDIKYLVVPTWYTRIKFHGERMTFISKFQNRKHSHYPIWCIVMNLICIPYFGMRSRRRRRHWRL